MKHKLTGYGLKLFVFLTVVVPCTFLLSCASVSFSTPNNVAVPEDFFGISPDRSPLNPEDFQLLTEFNATWIRTTVRWSGVERKQGEWNFDQWDEYLAKAEAAGKKVIWILGFDNGWLFKDNKERRKLNAEQLPLYLNYVEQVVRRYGTRVVYEIWNEPNGIFWKGSNKDFYKLSAAAAKKIRETEPEATILAASTFLVDVGFTRGMFDSGAMENVDGFSTHPYGLFDPQSTIRSYERLQKVLDEKKFKGTVWVTEVGYMNGPEPFLSTKHHAEHVVKTLSGLAVRADKIRNMIWYELMDNYNPGEVKNPLMPYNYLGLIYPNGTYKPGAEAFMLTANALANSKYNPDIPIRENVGKKITSLYFVKEDGTSTLIIWNDGSGKKKIRFAVPEAENLSSHNIHNREIEALSGDIVLEIGKEPTFITWKGGKAPSLTKYRR